MSCFILGCKTGYMRQRLKNKEAGRKNYSFFTARTDEMLHAWRNAIPRNDKVIRKKDRVCELHFKETDIEKEYITRMPDGTVVRIPKGKATLKIGAVPSIFPKYHSTRVELIIPSCGDEEIKNDQSQSVNIKTEAIISEASISMQQSQISTSQENTCIPDVKPDLEDLCDFKDVILNVPTSTELPTISIAHDQPPILNPYSQYDEPNSKSDNKATILSPFETIAQNFKSIPVPSELWFSCFAYGCAMWSAWKADLSAVQNQLIISPDMKIQVIVEGQEVTVPGIGKVESIVEVAPLLEEVSRLRRCETAGSERGITDCAGYVIRKKQERKGLQVKRCDSCKKHRKALLNKSRKTRPLEEQQQKTTELRGRCANIKKRHARLKKEVTRLNQDIKAIKAECAEADTPAIDTAISKLTADQKQAVQACFEASKLTCTKGVRYNNRWIYKCLLLRMKSIKTYNHLRTQKILALPSANTLNRYIKIFEEIYGCDKNVFRVMKEKYKYVTPR